MAEYLVDGSNDHFLQEFFIDRSCVAKQNGLAGEEDMLKQFSYRQELELVICREVFPNKYTILKSKGYKKTDIQ